MLYTDPNKIAAMGLLSAGGVSPHFLPAYAGVAAGGKLSADPKMSSILARKIAEKPVSLQVPGMEGLSICLPTAK